MELEQIKEWGRSSYTDEYTIRTERFKITVPHTLIRHGVPYKGRYLKVFYGDVNGKRQIIAVNIYTKSELEKRK